VPVLLRCVVLLIIKEPSCSTSCRWSDVRLNVSMRNLIHALVNSLALLETRQDVSVVFCITGIVAASPRKVQSPRYHSATGCPARAGGTKRRLTVGNSMLKRGAWQRRIIVPSKPYLAPAARAGAPALPQRFNSHCTPVRKPRLLAGDFPGQRGRHSAHEEG
jgi:hypothetical protein